MRRLKTRKAEGHLPNEPRSNRRAVIRWIYLVCVLALIVWLLDLFLGGLVFLRSEGMVLGEPAGIATEFPATVREIRVREGDQVSAGDVAAIVSSQNVAEGIARLTAELAALEAQLSQLRIRSEMVDSLVPAAEERQKIAAETRREIERLVDKGFVPLDKRTSVVEMDFRSRQDLQALRAERRIVRAEAESLRSAVDNAAAALQDLKRLYDDGRLRSPIRGTVGRVLSDRGSVVRIGDPIFEIYGEDRFVLAYVPTGRIYDVAVGDNVEIAIGPRRLKGRISRIEQLAAALPGEFQRGFSPVQRQQVMRVTLGPNQIPPPLFTKVRVREPSIVGDIAAAVQRLLADWLN